MVNICVENFESKILSEFKLNTYTVNVRNLNSSDFGQKYFVRFQYLFGMKYV